jgi:hypothetical protein
MVLVDEKENWPELVALTSSFSVELPGIEPGSKIDLSCVNAGINDAKVRETTRRYSEDVDGINAFGSTAQRGKHLESPVAQRPPPGLGR